MIYITIIIIIIIIISVKRYTGDGNNATNLLINGLIGTLRSNSQTRRGRWSGWTSANARHGDLRLGKFTPGREGKGRKEKKSSASSLHPL